MLMKCILCLAFLALVSAAGRGYDRCKFNGQFLPNDYDECSYFRCDYGNEPWYDNYGNIKFVEVKMKCAYGTSTNPHKFDPYNPCGEVSYKCKAPKRQSYKPHDSYHPRPHGASYHDDYHPQDAASYHPYGAASYHPYGAASYHPHGASYPHGQYYSSYHHRH